MAFETNVFINCPFDEKYRPILRAILFCIYYLGFQPRIAVERLNGAEARIEKLIELIEGSKYGIHDLSRLKAEKAGEIYRLNMPLELGLDIGCQRFKGGEHSDKRCLILETERFRYQAALSDLANSDIEPHGDEPLEALTVVRNWLDNEANLGAKGPSYLWGRFGDFMVYADDILLANGHSRRDIDRLPMAEWMRLMRQWPELGT
jgi:hypothetical protein